MSFQDGQKYAAECVSAKLTASPKTGTEGIELRFQTEEGTTEDTLWLTDKTIDQVDRVLKILGVDPENFNPLNGDLDLLLGGRCILKMGAEEFKGKTKIRVHWIDPLEVPINRERVAAFFNRQKQKVPVAATAPDNDDIPF
jgi:hypothetical protein